MQRTDVGGRTTGGNLKKRTRERLHRARKQRRLGGLDGRGRANMHPEAFQAQTDQPSGRCGAVEER